MWFKSKAETVILMLKEYVFYMTKENKNEN